MINLKPTNIKLKKRVIRIVVDIAEKTEQEAVCAFEKNEWNIKDTIKFLSK